MIKKNDKTADLIDLATRIKINIKINIKMRAF